MIITLFQNDGNDVSALEKYSETNISTPPQYFHSSNIVKLFEGSGYYFPCLIILYEYLYLLNRFSKFICLLDFRFIVNISHVHIASCKHMAKIFPAQMFHLSWNLICFSSVILFAGQTSHRYHSGYRHYLLKMLLHFLLYPAAP